MFSCQTAPVNDRDRGGPPAPDLDRAEAGFLRAVLEAVPAFILRLDPEERILYMNRLQSGFTLDDVIGRSGFDFVDPAYHERQRHAIDEALRTGAPSGYLAKGAGPDGTVSYYQSHAVPIDNGDGRRAVCVIALEVTEHVARAAALKESEEKLRLAVEATGLGLWAWDLINNTYEYDARVIELLGGVPESPDAYVAQFVHGEDRDRVRRDLRMAEQGSGDFHVHRVVRPDGSERWLLPTGQALKDEEGRPSRLVGGLLDVTEQRRVEEHLRQAQKMDAVGSLTAGVAHNFNNMLAVILPALEMALPRVEPDLQAALADAMHAAKRSAELVTQLMTFAGQRQTNARKAQRLGPVVERAVTMCQGTFDRHVNLTVSIDPDGASVVCDAPAIEQVMVNLLINARDAVFAAERQEPAIAVEVSDVDVVGQPGPPGAVRPHVRIRVRDNGTGMSDVALRRALEPFFTTKEPGKGTGLGLATSYRILRDHGGSIALRSQEGAGTVAEVLLPVAGLPGIERHDVPPRASGQDGRTILVVDDEPAVRRVIELVLADRGHRVVAASDGQAAAARLAAGLQPDLILLDRSMPGWSAKITLHEIRKLAPRTPLLFFTGQDVTPEERALVQDVLYKPLAMEDLVQAIEHWIGRG